MKTIEELAIERGAIKTTQNLFTEQRQYVLSVSQLEALCKAYLQDRLESLETVAWKYRYTDYVNFEVSLLPFSEDDLVWIKAVYENFEIHELHDISTLKDKP